VILTLPIAKKHLNIPTSNTANDGELIELIEGAEASVASRCGPLEPTTVTERVSGLRSSLRPRVKPVISITSATPVGGAALSLLDLELDPVTGVLSTVSGTGFWSRLYDLVYVAGRTSLPADLLLGVKEQLRYLWQTQLGNTLSVGALPEDQFAAAESLGALARRSEQLIRPYVQIGEG
jgi:hypothetical protein